MNVFEVIGKIVVWAFIVGIGVFILTIISAFIIGLANLIKEKKHEQK